MSVFRPFSDLLSLFKSGESLLFASHLPLFYSTSFIILCILLTALLLTDSLSSPLSFTRSSSKFWPSLCSWSLCFLGGIWFMLVPAESQVLTPELPNLLSSLFCLASSLGCFKSPVKLNGPKPNLCYSTKAGS